MIIVTTLSSFLSAVASYTRSLETHGYQAKMMTIAHSFFIRKTMMSEYQPMTMKFMNVRIKFLHEVG